MYGIVLRVTPSDTLRKMNQDNIVCHTLTSNIMNDYEHDMNTVTIWYQTCASLCNRTSYEDTLSTVLVTPRPPSLGTCHEWLMFRSWCVYRTL